MNYTIYNRYYVLNNTDERVDRKGNPSMAGIAYDLTALAGAIAGSVDRNGKDYLDHHDWQIDLTMSCSREEAIGWLECWMMEAIFGGSGTFDPQLRAKFLSAYDLRCSLRRGIAS